MLGRACMAGGGIDAVFVILEASGREGIIAWEAVIRENFGHHRLRSSVCKSNRLHVGILRLSFIKLGYIL